ncbi:hypothetical protein [Arenicella xantha]|uniref:Uncharacterized protein n=1 Tax=Arenicella xantha TaxID=644221 RepID=A0A395JLX8_9GAMM|nr:hypothetical protein [Arenicella xantha]RBP48790.1 hypothetical protein DFR28_105129 [Arenicella xantha]
METYVSISVSAKSIKYAEAIAICFRSIAAHRGDAIEIAETQLGNTLLEPLITEHDLAASIDGVEQQKSKVLLSFTFGSQGTAYAQRFLEVFQNTAKAVSIKITFDDDVEELEYEKVFSPTKVKKGSLKSSEFAQEFLFVCAVYEPKDAVNAVSALLDLSEHTVRAKIPSQFLRECLTADELIGGIVCRRAEISKCRFRVFLHIALLETDTIRLNRLVMFLNLLGLYDIYAVPIEEQGQQTVYLMSNPQEFVSAPFSRFRKSDITTSNFLSASNALFNKIEADYGAWDYAELPVDNGIPELGAEIASCYGPTMNRHTLPEAELEPVRTLIERAQSVSNIDKLLSMQTLYQRLFELYATKFPHWMDNKTLARYDKKVASEVARQQLDPSKGSPRLDNEFWSLAHVIADTRESDRLIRLCNVFFDSII